MFTTVPQCKKRATAINIQVLYILYVNRSNISILEFIDLVCKTLILMQMLLADLQ